MKIEPCKPLQVWEACKQITVLNKLSDSITMFPDTLNLARMIFKEEFPQGINRFNEQLPYAGAVIPGLIKLQNMNLILIMRSGRETWNEYREWMIVHLVMARMRDGTLNEAVLVDSIEKGFNTQFW